jgi:hypothetical protein
VTPDSERRPREGAATVRPPASEDVAHRTDETDIELSDHPTVQESVTGLDGKKRPAIRRPPWSSDEDRRPAGVTADAYASGTLARWLHYRARALPGRCRCACCRGEVDR